VAQDREPWNNVELRFSDARGGASEARRESEWQPQ
jgi:hypothetical protein